MAFASIGLTSAELLAASSSLASPLARSGWRRERTAELGRNGLLGGGKADCSAIVGRPR